MHTTSDRIIGITIFLLDVINSSLHIFGCYLLIYSYRTQRRKSTQDVFLINLAFIEFIWNFMSVIRDVFAIFIELVLGFWYIHLFLWTGGLCMVITSLFLLTADRLLHVVLGIRYTTSVHKAWTLVICTSAINIIIGVTAAILWQVSPSHTHTIGMVTYVIITSLYVIYFLFTSIAYSIMFRKYLITRRNPLLQEHDYSLQQTSTWNLFKNSKFFIPVLLSSTFLIFNVLPSIAFTIYLSTYKQHSVVPSKA